MYFLNTGIWTDLLAASAAAALVLIAECALRRHRLRTSCCPPLNPSHGCRRLPSPGPKGDGIQILHRLKARVPRGVYIPWHTLETMQTPPGEQDSPVVAAIAAQLSSNAVRAGIPRLIVRSSFAVEDDRNMYPGIFASIGSIDAGDAAGLARALTDVLNSLQADAAQVYRDSIDADRALQGGAILVQEHKLPTVAITASSFNPVGRRPDEMRMELQGTNDAASIVYYNRQFRKFQAGDEAFAMVPEPCLNEIVRVIESSEMLVGGPVIVECGMLDGTLYHYQVRRQHLTPVDVWINQGPVDLSTEPLAPLALELAYGSDCGLVTAGVQAAFRGTLKTPVTVRPVNHRCYVRFNDLLQQHFDGLRPRLWGTPPAEAVMRDVPDTLPARQSVAVLRTALLRQARIQRTGSILTAYADQLRRPRGNASSKTAGWRQSLAGILENFAAGYLKDARVSHEATSALTTQTMDMVIKEAGNPKNGPFMTMRELVQGHLPPDSVIEPRRRAYAREAQIAAQPTVPRLPNHALPFHADGDMLRLIRLFDGRARGQGFLPEAFDGTVPQDKYILLLPDASLRWQPFLIGAQGVIIAGDRALSHLALQIQELGIPALMGATPENLYALHATNLELEETEPVVRRVKTL